MKDEGTNVYAPTEMHVDDVGPVGTLVLASRGSRLGAWLIDTIILLVPMFLASFAIMGSWTGFTGGGQGLDEGKEMLVTVVGAVSGIALYALINWRLLERAGQTVGKRLLGIRIVRSDGSAAGARHIVLRRYTPYSLLGAIPLLGPFISLLNVCFIFLESRKCLHDEVADTIVVEA
jgi:uncharacterized RDD family membrane protein YckC